MNCCIEALAAQRLQQNAAWQGGYLATITARRELSLFRKGKQMLHIISGHAPCDTRQAFLDSIEAGEPDRKLVGNLWNCTDILPGTYCDDLGIPHGSTYAQAARLLKQNPGSPYRLIPPYARR